MAQYGEVRVDYITYTTGTSPNQANATVTVSSLVNAPTFSGDVNISGALVIDQNATVGGELTVSGVSEFASGTAAAPSITFIGDNDLGLFTSAANTLDITTNGSRKVTVNQDGKVGIGTSSPTQLIDLETSTGGRIAFTDTGTRRYSIGNAGTGSSSLTIRDESGSADRIVIDNSGQVGIGNSDPDEILTVGNTTGNHIIRMRAGATGVNGLDFGDANDADVGRIRYAHTDDSLQITVNAAERLRINSSGNVGIGTSSPSTLFVVSNNGAHGFEVLPQLNGDTVLTTFNRSTSAYHPMRVRASVFKISPEGTEKVRITGTGRVGIGTTQPSHLLHVNRSADNFIVLSTGTSAASTEQGLLNYGRFISGTTPGFPGQLTSFIKEQRNASAADFALLFGTTDDGSTDATERMRIDGSGDVGIGLTSPASKLHTNGSRDYTGSTPSSSSYDVNFQSGTAYLAIGQSNGVPAIQGHGTGTGYNLALAPNAGNVGIGTTSPGSRLEIEDGGGSGSAQVLRVKRANGTDACVFRIDLDPDENIVKYQATGTQNGAHAFGVGGGSESMRIDSSGRLLIGTSSTRTYPNGQGQSQDNQLQLESNGDICGLTLSSFRSNNTGPANLILSKANGSQTTPTSVTSSSILGQVTFNGYDGSNFIRGAKIEAAINGTPGTNDMPTRLSFYTTAESSTTPTERLRITADGNVGIGTTDPGALLHLQGSSFTNLEIDALTNDPTLTLKSSVGEWTLRTDRSVSDQFVMRWDNSAKLALTTAGNLGLGTTSPNNLLSLASTAPRIEVTDTSTDARFLIDCNSTAGSVAFRVDQDDNTANSAAIFNIDNSEKMRLAHNNRLALGTTNTGVCLRLTVTETDTDFDPANGNTTSVAALMGGATAGLNQVGGTLCLTKVASTRPGAVIAAVQTSSDADQMGLAFYTHESATASDTVVEQARLHHAGHFIVGSTSVIAESSGSITGATIYTNGITGFSATNDRALFLKRLNSDGSIQTFRRDNTLVGSISVTTTSTTYNTSSDYRLKENVVELNGAIARVNQLQPKRFNFIAEPGITVDGFLAHEAQSIVPEAVTGTHDEVDDEGNPVMQQIDQSKLVPLLTAALQEALAKIETLEQRLNSAGL